MARRRGQPRVAGNKQETRAHTGPFGPNKRDPARAAAAAALLIAGACSGSPEPIAAAPPYLDPGFVQAGGYRMNYALTMTLDLPSGIAGSYGIVQRRNLAVLTVTFGATDAGPGAPAAAAELEATQVALTGEREPLRLERHDAAGSATWLATVEVRHRVPITIEIRAHATPASPELRARLTREFRLD